MRRSRRRRRRRYSTPFRAWGLTLLTLAVILASQELWWQMLMTIGVLSFYLSVVRLTRCRVETQNHRPCLWRVRGLLGTCDYHVGYKRSLPVLVRGEGFLGLPTFMWPRDDFARTVNRPERQPGPRARGPAATANKARRPGYDWSMMAIAGLSAVLAIVALIRDFVAG